MADYETARDAGTNGRETPVRIQANSEAEVTRISLFTFAFYSALRESRRPPFQSFSMPLATFLVVAAEVVVLAVVPAYYPPANAEP